MKLKLISICLLFLSPFLSAQIGEVINYSAHSIQVKKPKATNGTRSIGSPYIFSNYLVSLVIGHDEIIELKYNAYTDEMEFEHEGQFYNLNKEEYPEVFLGPQKLKYIYTNYNDGKNSVSGFLRVLDENEKWSIYVKEKVSYTPPAPSKDSYTTEKPEVYKREKDHYFMRMNDAIFEIPTNKKKFAALFSSKEKEVLNYISSEKLSLNKEVDLVKLSRFIEKM